VRLIKLESFTVVIGYRLTCYKGMWRLHRKVYCRTVCDTRLPEVQRLLNYLHFLFLDEVCEECNQSCKTTTKSTSTNVPNATPFSALNTSEHQDELAGHVTGVQALTGSAMQNTYCHLLVIFIIHSHLTKWTRSTTEVTCRIVPVENICISWVRYNNQVSRN